MKSRNAARAVYVDQNCVNDDAFRGIIVIETKLLFLGFMYSSPAPRSTTSKSHLPTTAFVQMAGQFITVKALD